MKKGQISHPVSIRIHNRDALSQNCAYVYACVRLLFFGFFTKEEIKTKSDLQIFSSIKTTSYVSFRSSASQAGSIKACTTCQFHHLSISVRWELIQTKRLLAKIKKIPQKSIVYSGSKSAQDFELNICSRRKGDEVQIRLT